MTKKILISLAVIGIIAVAVIGGTIAYFSDTETSTGNTFTAGDLDLTIDNECYYNGEPVSECTWELDDLDGKLFFNFTDLKPGDWGEDTVSLHVTNDAWACVTITPTAAWENGMSEPEKEYGDTTWGQWGGELQNYLEFFFWADVCDEPDAYPGDNIFQPGCDYELMYGPAGDIVPDGAVYTLADADENNVGGENGEPLYESNIYHIGKVWCFGKWEGDGENGYYCDGSEVDNDAQTDQLIGNIEFYAEQFRNNPDFICGENGGVDEEEETGCTMNADCDGGDLCTIDICVSGVC